MPPAPGLSEELESKAASAKAAPPVVSTASVSSVSYDRMRAFFVLVGPVSACAGDFVGLPFDVLKVRLQLEGTHLGVVEMARRVHAQHGPAGFFKGLYPAQFRQFTYGGLRFNAWHAIKRTLGADGAEPALWRSVVAGGLAGAVSSSVCTPADVVKIRMQANPTTYHGVFQTMALIARTEGPLKLYRGVTPTSVRAAAVAAAELGSYDFIKTRCLSRGWLEEGRVMHFAAGLASGVCAIIVSFPLDVAKTRMIQQGSGGSAEKYRGIFHCVWQTAKEKGVLGLYNGSLPAVIRQCSATVVQWMVYEELMSLVKL